MARKFIGFLWAWALLIGAGFSQASGEIFYYHTDHLGSVRMMTDTQSAVARVPDYLPFGEEVTSAESDAFGFTGKWRDTETGLHYFGARYYAGPLGRWESPDAIDSDVIQGNPQTWNLYVYARNNPTTFVDPDGRIAWRAAITVGRILWRGGNIALEIHSIYEDVTTLVAANSNLQDRAVAAASLASGLPVKKWVKAGSTIAHNRKSLNKYLTVAGGAEKKLIGAETKLIKDGEQVVARGGVGNVSREKLTADAARSEAGGFPHGVSGRSAPGLSGEELASGRFPNGQFVESTKGKLEEAGFKVHGTPTRTPPGDPHHVTIELPKPVSQEVADRFNACFSCSKPNPNPRK